MPVIISKQLPSLIVGSLREIYTAVRATGCAKNGALRPHLSHKPQLLFLELDTHADVVASTDGVIRAGIGLGTGRIARQSANERRCLRVERIVNA